MYTKMKIQLVPVAILTLKFGVLSREDPVNKYINIGSWIGQVGISPALSYIWSENSHPKSEAKDSGN